jgi:hypothetical protein
MREINLDVGVMLAGLVLSDNVIRHILRSDSKLTLATTTYAQTT